MARLPLIRARMEGKDRTSLTLIVGYVSRASRYQSVGQARSGCVYPARPGLYYVGSSIGPCVILHRVPTGQWEG